VTSPPCQSAAFGRIVAPWAAVIAELFAGIVATILTIAENIRDTVPELGAGCRKAGRLPALRPVLSRPMMPKLGFLPSSASARHSLARQRSPALDDAVGCALIADIGGSARTGSPATPANPANLVAAIGDAEEELMDLEDREAKGIERVLEARGTHAPT